MDSTGTRQPIPGTEMQGCIRHSPNLWWEPGEHAHCPVCGPDEGANGSPVVVADVDRETRTITLTGVGMDAIEQGRRLGKSLAIMHMAAAQQRRHAKDEQRKRIVAMRVALDRIDSDLREARDLMRSTTSMQERHSLSVITAMVRRKRKNMARAVKRLGAACGDDEDESETNAEQH
jgi:hypothetical protein